VHPSLPVGALADNRTVTSVCFVCTGNICRSPIAEVVLRAYVADAGLDVQVSSAGTGDWHVGGPADPRTVRALDDAGYDGSAHRARQFDASWFADLDLVVALDRSHLSDLRALAPSAEDRAKVVLLRSFDASAQGAGALDVADPYHGGALDFERVLAEVEAACGGLVAYLAARRAAPTFPTAG
jgi:protein-tyrosine phosphatase